MERRSRNYDLKAKRHQSASQELPRTPVSTRETHVTDSDRSSNACSRQKELWSWFLESLGQEQEGPPTTSTHPQPAVEAMQKELLTDLIRRCAEYQQSEAERRHKENFETWRKFTRAAVDYAWDEAIRRNAATDCSEKDLTEEMDEEREENGETMSAAEDEAPPVLIGLPSDEEALSEGSEKKRRDHMYRQERRERVRRWVKEQRELVLSQKEAKKHVQVPKHVARTWLDQLKAQAARERSEFRTRAPGTVCPTSEQRRYPWDDYLREKNGMLVPKSDKARR